MPQSTLEIYERLLAGERIKVSLESKCRYDILRTELTRHHRITKDLLELSEHAICSSYKDEVGTFHIGVPGAGKTIKMVISTEISNDSQVRTSVA